jgi:hypothetical protein
MSIVKSPALNLMVRDLADADAHLIEALALINGRVPRTFSRQLLTLSECLRQVAVQPEARAS